MSKEVLEQVVLKASSDARFRSQLNDNFESAVRPYDLSPDEKSKLRSGIAGGIGDDREVRRTMAASHASSSTEAASNQAASNEAMSHQAASNEVASNEVASNEVASSEVASNEASSHLTMEN
jgi:hypothetical protein